MRKKEKTAFMGRIPKPLHQSIIRIIKVYYTLNVDYKYNRENANGLFNK